MNLTITPDLIRELWDTARSSSVSPRQVGIVLTAVGWDVRVWPDASQLHWPVAMTADAFDTWMDGDEYDPDAADAIAAGGDGVEGLPYRIVDEAGRPVDPLNGARPAVVVDTTDADGQDDGWEGAWWFDLSAARMVIGEQAGEYRESGAAQEVWLTLTGRWVVYTRSVVGGAHDGWEEITRTQAAHWVYNTDPDRVCDDPPPLAAAALATRELAEMIRAPRIRHLDYGDGIDHADVDAPATAVVVHDLAALSDLLRTGLLPALRSERAQAARHLHDHHHGDTRATAAYLGLSPKTVADLIAPEG